MEQFSLRSLVRFYCNSVRFKGITLLLSIAFLCCFSDAGFAAVTISSATGGTNICSNKATGGSSPAFTTIGTIAIYEGANGDINGAAGGITNTIVLNAPTGWQFNPVLPTFSFTTGSNVTAVSGSITSTTLTINITANNTNGSDQVYISGLQVQATSSSSSAGYIYASSVTGVTGITIGSTGTNFGNLSLLAPVAPSVSITASPAGAVCPGTAVTFTPSPVNGGSAPSYQWLVNGVNVATSSTYINSSLSTGNTVACNMISTASCISSASAASNTIVMTINPAPAAITGSSVVCPGVSASLSSATSGGAWSSSATGVATVNSSGVVSGVSAGTARISYLVATCSAVKTIYVNSTPVTPVLTPTVSTICNGGTVGISASGTPLPTIVMSQDFNSGISPWVIDSSGSVGTVVGSQWKTCHNGYINEQGIYFSPDSSSFAMSNSDTSGSASYTSSKLISPVFSLAGYSAATLSFQHAYEHWPAGDYNADLQISTNGGSTWATLKSYVGANVGTKTSFAADSFSLNAYLGLSNLKVRFYYYCHWGYYWAVENVMVTGISSVVTPTWSPATYLFTDAALTTPYTAGSAASTVYANPTTISTLTTLTYTATATIPGCSTTKTSAITVNPTPGVISGSFNICVASSTSLTSSVSSGTWSSTNPSVASITSGGVVTGLVPGTTTISYTVATGCAATVVVTVNTTPAAIGGPSSVCIASTISLTNTTTGGTWSSGSASIATIGSTTGVVTGVAAGNSVITYTLGAGCTVVKTISVNPLPNAITGTLQVCKGLTTSLGSATSGGTWSSNNTSIATVGVSSGVVTGVAAGTTDITYTIGTGCYTIASLTVNPLEPITGTAAVCLGQTASLANSVAGGTWSSNNTAIATVTSGGVVSGVATGNTTISYQLGTGCIATRIVTVNPLPANITGIASVCQGLTTTLFNATTGGTWSSGNDVIGSVGSASGIVSGVTPGIVTISYTIGTGCFTTANVTVNPLSAITGSLNVCLGQTSTLGNATGGGIWSNTTSLASIGSSSGIVTGLAIGTTIITYTLPTSCVSTAVITINPLPASITGPSSVCEGSTVSLSDATSGGTWSSSSASVASVGSTTGVVFGNTDGNTVISYTLPTGCAATLFFTVNPLPSVIGGPSTVCVSSTISLTNAIAGGSWTSGFTPVASVGATTGIVNGVAPGVTYIVYTLPTTCLAIKNITVNPLPAAITGTASVCEGLTATLSNSTTGGTWSSSNTTVATIGISNGVVSGLASGTTVITYTLPSGCTSTVVFTVNPLPPAIGGTASVCAGLATTLTNTVTGGTWSGSTSVAIINSSSGIVNGFTAGTAVMTYTLPTGCLITRVVTVNPLPAAITGITNVCVGLTSSLFDATSGGSWFSANSFIATVGSGSGVVTGVAAGTVIVSYVLPTGCKASTFFTVNPLPATIGGPTSVCIGYNAGLSNATGGGTWSSSNISIATIGSSSGVATGLAIGSTVIAYTLPTGCASLVSFAVNPLPAVITGASAVCEGSTATLNNVTGGGSWSSSNTTVATIGSATGIVAGNIAGTTTISYTLGTGCYVTKIVTVNTTPVAITGSGSICLGGVTALSNTTSGGTWSSSNTSVAAIGSSSGVAIGYATGTATISYILASGCFATTTVTVYPSPPAITGPSAVCQGLDITLSNTVTGGTWSSTNPAVATVGSGSGIVTGASGGTANIIYSLASGCTAVKTITVNPAPPAIAGTTSICFGVNATLSNTVTGGTWASANGFVASIGVSSGIVTALNPGTSTITYTTPGGCLTTTTILVNTVSPITGSLGICSGGISTLSSAISGGTWGSSSASVVSIGLSSGFAAGGSIGTATITYTQPSGCKALAIATVNPTPASITGTASVCAGLTTTLGNTTSGGTWSSGNAAIAMVGSSSGIVTGVAGGIAAISYILPTGCAAIRVVTVSAFPSAISGSSAVCLGSTTTLGNTVSGGTWSSNSSSIASVGSASGIVTGNFVSSTTISYTTGIGCTVTMNVTVNPLPGTISGLSSVCQGLTITLGNITSGGTWVSGNTAVAIAGSTTGIISGMAGGTSLISYVLPTGCFTTKVVSVNTLPSPITGSLNACLGYTTTLANTTGGGTWSSSNTSVATIGITNGIVNGLSLGTATITYTPGTGCITTAVITVNSAPTAISGVGSVCTGNSITLSNTVTGGSWSSGSTSVATVGSLSGIVTGVAAGTASITYAVGSGCMVTATITVNASPAAIGGTPVVCEGATITLTNATTGGTWGTGSTSIAMPTSGLGVVNGIAAGTSTVTYTVSSGCSAIVIVTVNPVPPAIAGATNVCASSSTILSNAVTGGAWASGNIAIATVGPTTGSVTGVAAGVVTITYTIPTGCYATKPVTVDPLPAAISGTLNICPGFTSSLSSATPGGAWSSGNTSVATIGAATGVASGITAGTAGITYTLGTGCAATKILTVNTLYPTMGSLNLCTGATSTLSNATGSGTWSSSNTAIATVGLTTGVVAGVAAGTAVITFTFSSGCWATSVVTVNLSPSAITGTMVFCEGAPTTLSNTIGGGSWSSSSTSIAEVGSASGIVTGMAGGTAIISYSLGTGCVSTAVITVNPLPAPISGTPTLCESFTTTLSNTIVGGTWSSSNVAVATIGGAGIVNGIATGTSTISYTLSTGCRTTLVVTVSNLTAITGTTTVCTGLATSLSNSTAGGTWSSSNTSVATIGSATGIATGVFAGTAIITYAYGTGCWVTATVTVHPVPSVIAGTAAVCVSSVTTLSSTPTGGTWSISGAGSIATIDASTGVVDGLTAGNATATYTLPTGCISSKIVTVNPLPASISGTMQVCEGLSTTLTDASPSGGWGSSNPSVAAIGPGTGIVDGVAAGTANITYTLPTGCKTISVFTVNPLPSAISGTPAVCLGLTTTLGNTLTGGTWVSSNVTVATIGTTSGIVTGEAVGTAVITYTLPTGCTNTVVVTVNPLPAAITGTMAVCQGLVTTLSNVTAGGTWSAASGIVSVGVSTGVVTGISAGTATVTYTIGTGCISTAVITVNPLPATITGPDNVCVGSAIVLSESSTGGTWLSGTTAVATIAPVTAGTALLNGVSAGTTSITYTLPTGCIITKIITVNALPAPITGTAVVCAGSSITLGSATTGGAWTSGTPAIAAADVVSGTITGVSAGVANITYTLLTSCSTATTVTVNPVPAAISGALNVCLGSATSLSTATAGGYWSSGAPSIAIINAATGVATGISPGTSIISYTLPTTGCRATAVVTVNPLPAAITGSANVCAGSSITLSNTSTGGTWSSSNVTVATIGSATGILNGVIAGNVAITYKLPTGCYIVKGITVNALPSAISGPTSVCQGFSTTLSNSTPGGTWSSSFASTATAGSATGEVTGISAGVVAIYYTLGTGCAASTAFTVYPLAPITGAFGACLGSSITLSNSVPGGTWSSSAPGIASIGSASGLVNGLSLGTANITYALPSGCTAIRTITVNPAPSAVTGAAPLCQGHSLLLSCATTGGSWSSTTPTIASVGSLSGLVTAVSPGTAMIAYVLPTGCLSTAVITVNPLAPITGSTNTCIGTSTLLTNTVAGGTWSSSVPSVATIGSASGILNPLVAGTTIVSYSLSTGCLATLLVTVNPLPFAFVTTGGGDICTGSPGVPVGLSGSQTGVYYQLFRDTTFVTTMSGTGFSLSFGAFSVAGTYTVRAADAITGCIRPMSGAAVITLVAFVSPAVSITTGVGDTACLGASTTFTPIPVNGGTTPLYQWRVNGISVGSGPTYSYVPVAGDIVTCKLTSSAACVSPDTAVSSITVTVIPFVMPVVGATAAPGDTVCQFTPVTLTATSMYGGGAPVYTWMKNGVNVGLGATYSFTPADGDVVYCKMASNRVCRSADTAYAPSHLFSVAPYLTPSVTITATPGLVIIPGQSDTLTAVATNAGPAPLYQWLVNGIAIPGATSSVYISNSFSNKDSVSCIVTSSGVCSGITGSGYVHITLDNVGVAQASAGTMLLLPNPNKGSFIVTGTISPTIGDIYFEITNMLGQSVYSRAAKCPSGKVTEPFNLGNQLANGMYILNLTAGNENYVFHFVVGQ